MSRSEGKKSDRFQTEDAERHDAAGNERLNLVKEADGTATETWGLQAHSNVHAWCIPARRRESPESVTGQ